MYTYYSVPLIFLSSVVLHIICPIRVLVVCSHPPRDLEKHMLQQTNYIRTHAVTSLAD